MNFKEGSVSVTADAGRNESKKYETPRLEVYGDAAAITKTLDVHKVDDVDIAAQGSTAP